MQLWTLGHGTASESELAALLQSQGIENVVDVRKIPKSGKHPHVWAEKMALWVPTLSGATYEWHPEFGGFRKADPDSPNVALRNTSFRAYADYMQTPQFLGAFDELMRRAEQSRIAIMCSESVWWRCHRRLMSDAATLLHDADVQHIMHTGKTTPHKLTEGVRVTGQGVLQYDAGEERLL
ncbi:MAG: DUF488 domain-containing protein [Candidatus Eremiobacteraeota bacterium]|nr:DUF488 domain-containing protein [Candidatus Eremiobacteraeota bacterium]